MLSQSAMLPCMSTAPEGSGSGCRSKLKEQNDVDVACHIEAESGNISRATLKV